MGNRTSTARDEAAAAQSIGHFDHNYDAILIDQSAGMVEACTDRKPVPAAVQRVLGDGRYVELVMKFDTVQLVENQKTHGSAFDDAQGDAATHYLLLATHYSLLLLTT